MPRRISPVFAPSLRRGRTCDSLRDEDLGALGYRNERWRVLELQEGKPMRATGVQALETVQVTQRTHEWSKASRSSRCRSRETTRGNNKPR
jgi:hypothetical protein